LLLVVLLILQVHKFLALLALLLQSLLRVMHPLLGLSLLLCILLKVAMGLQAQGTWWVGK
jgi:hypothetical protein